MLGYGDDEIITFRTSKNQVANNCGVTETVIDNFNNPKRLDENHWITFYGKKNRLDHCSFFNKNGQGILLNAVKTSLLDSLSVDHCVFEKHTGTLFNFMHEDDKKGYYNVEKLSITNNTINKQQGQILGMLRSGNDESTMGPYLIFENNVIEKSNSKDPLIYLYGTQRTVIVSNKFLKSNEKNTLIKYEDAVRANHVLKNNEMFKSGSIKKDVFVEE